MIYRFNKISIKISMTIFTDIDKNIVKVMQSTYDPRQSMILSKKNNTRSSRGSKSPD